ncbi:MAG: GNAT family N-acetyltransferase [Acidobacteria bacterium]|nr:GNAT family N-acetyltransferase [Acidobacteriota bacterium]MBV9067223.1 GNAT family N-acetyltransferase [Acidobacteriota bacterium]MBV9186478.1 GNAT family N-acetyltransferase [Acidobacteriota bacterium]
MVFWDSQPVVYRPRTLQGGVSPPVPRPWTIVDFNGEDAFAEVASFLEENYVADRSESLRLTYSEEFLRWALSPYATRRAWRFGARADDGSLVGFIGATEIPLVVCGDRENSAVVNFLCVRDDHRRAGLAPALIAALTKAVNATGIFTALFTTSMDIPVEPVATCRYWCRLLDPTVLAEAGFLPQPRDLEVLRAAHALPSVTPERFPALAPSLAGAVAERMERWSSRFALRAAWGKEDILRWISGGVSVFADGSGIGAYNRVSIRTAGKRTINAAYLIALTSDGCAPQELLNRLIVEAARADCHVFFALPVMSLGDALGCAGFLPTNARLSYYLFNWPQKAFCGQDVAFMHW